jgi:hypothetical protein
MTTKTQKTTIKSQSGLNVEIIATATCGSEMENDSVNLDGNQFSTSNAIIVEKCSFSATVAGHGTFTGIARITKDPKHTEKGINFLLCEKIAITEETYKELRQLQADLLASASSEAMKNDDEYAKALRNREELRKVDEAERAVYNAMNN